MFRRAWNLYYDGFRTMPRWARTLWMIVILKILVMFLVFKLIFMPNFLNSRYSTDEEKSSYVLEELTTKH